MTVGIHTFFLGLGLFFAGMILTGDRMRKIAGQSFHKVAARVNSPIFGGLVGMVFGGLMQSATAVTFILANMVRSNLITATVSLPIIMWANVGLTAFAFLVTVNIHPVVAWTVGLAGITLGLYRGKTLTSWAGLFFSIGLILLGLETMGEGAAPLQHAAWFHHALMTTTSSPVMAFCMGILAAAILQSNVGTVLLVVTLAKAGAFSIETSALIIYGSNLGAIFLRIFLSLGMDRPTFRLVRFEDFFCLWSGALMTTLFALEAAGIPLVLAFVRHITGSVDLQLAGIFLLSNFIPALTLHPWRNSAAKLLARLWPGEPPVNTMLPKFLNDTALEHPPTAIALVQKELCGLLRTIRAFEGTITTTYQAEEFQTSPAFAAVAAATDQFLAQLVSKNTLEDRTARAVQYQRAELSMIRYLAEAVVQFSYYETKVSKTTTFHGICEKMILRVNDLLDATVTAAEQLTSDSVTALYEASSKKNLDNMALRNALQALAVSEGGESFAEVAKENFDIVLWIAHRFSKLLLRGSAELPEL
ncbi:MAG: Na/Pi symporter [Chthoniobacterales bacterium]